MHCFFSPSVGKCVWRMRRLRMLPLLWLLRSRLDGLVFGRLLPSDCCLQGPQVVVDDLPVAQEGGAAVDPKGL